jgi:hypothetical protein
VVSVLIRYTRFPKVAKLAMYKAASRYHKHAISTCKANRPAGSNAMHRGYGESVKRCRNERLDPRHQTLDQPRRIARYSCSSRSLKSESVTRSMCTYRSVSMPEMIPCMGHGTRPLYLVMPLFLEHGRHRVVMHTTESLTCANVLKTMPMNMVHECGI